MSQYKYIKWNWYKVDGARVEDRDIADMAKTHVGMESSRPNEAHGVDVAEVLGHGGERFPFRGERVLRRAVERAYEASKARRQRFAESRARAAAADAGRSSRSADGQDGTARGHRPAPASGHGPARRAGQQAGNGHSARASARDDAGRSSLDRPLVTSVPDAPADRPVVPPVGAGLTPPPLAAGADPDIGAAPSRLPSTARSLLVLPLSLTTAALSLPFTAVRMAFDRWSRVRRGLASRRAALEDRLGFLRARLGHR